MKKEDMLKKENINYNDVIFYLSYFPPKWWKFPWSTIWDHQEFGKDLPEDFFEKFREWVKEYPDWKKARREEIEFPYKERGEEIPYNKGYFLGGDDYVRVHLGTSLEKAILFIQSGEGVVKSEDLWYEGNPLGLQVSIPNEMRGTLDRAWYYASKNFGTPCIMTFEIQRKYLMPQKNKGEYFLPQKFYNKIRGIDTCLTPEYYSKKWGVK